MRQGENEFLFDEEQSGDLNSLFRKKKNHMAKVATPENRDKDPRSTLSPYQKQISERDGPWRHIPGNVEAAGIRALPDFKLPDTRR